MSVQSKRQHEINWRSKTLATLTETSLLGWRSASTNFVAGFPVSPWSLTMTLCPTWRRMRALPPPSVDRGYISKLLWNCKFSILPFYIPRRRNIIQSRQIYNNCFISMQFYHPQQRHIFQQRHQKSHRPPHPPKGQIWGWQKQNGWVITKMNAMTNVRNALRNKENWSWIGKGERKSIRLSVFVGSEQDQLAFGPKSIYKELISIYNGMDWLTWWIMIRILEEDFPHADKPKCLKMV